MCCASAIYLLVLWAIAGGKVHVYKSLGFGWKDVCGVQ